MKARKKWNDRVVELRRVAAKELANNEGNWRIHPGAQAQALAAVVDEIGKADALYAYKSERNRGALVLLDGHLRKSIDDEAEWPVLVLDLTDEEADLWLATHDTVTGMAIADPERFENLVEGLRIAGDERLAGLFGDTKDAVAEPKATPRMPEVSTDAPQTTCRSFQLFYSDREMSEVQANIAFLRDKFEVEAFSEVIFEALRRDPANG